MRVPCCVKYGTVELQCYGFNEPPELINWCTNEPILPMSQRQAAFAHFNRAANLYRQVCYAQAVQYYLAGLEVDPMCVEAYADLAKAYEKLGCWNQAIESLETALRLRPRLPNRPASQATYSRRKKCL